MGWFRSWQGPCRRASVRPFDDTAVAILPIAGSCPRSESAQKRLRILLWLRPSRTLVSARKTCDGIRGAPIREAASQQEDVWPEGRPPAGQARMAWHRRRRDHRPRLPIMRWPRAPTSFTLRAAANTGTTSTIGCKQSGSCRRRLRSRETNPGLRAAGSAVRLCILSRRFMSDRLFPSA